MVAKAMRGHLAAAFSIVEILLVLYERILKYRPYDPNWDERDRFILSKGHGCLALYPILANKGFFPKDELYKFCKIDGILGGHPEHWKVPGVEASTGALGHGMSIGVGMSLRAKMDSMKYRTFVLLGDGECDEGTIWEAALSAKKHKLDNLVVLIDYNKYQSYGKISEVLELEPFVDKWNSFGFNVHEADLGVPENLEKILLDNKIYYGEKPNVVICHTIKGKGISFMENNLEWHHKARLTDSEVELLLSTLS